MLKRCKIFAALKFINYEFEMSEMFLCFSIWVFLNEMKNSLKCKLKRDISFQFTLQLGKLKKSISAYVQWC